MKSPPFPPACYIPSKPPPRPKIAKRKPRKPKPAPPKGSEQPKSSVQGAFDGLQHFSDAIVAQPGRQTHRQRFHHKFLTQPQSQVMVDRFLEGNSGTPHFLL